MKIEREPRPPDATREKERKAKRRTKTTSRRFGLVSPKHEEEEKKRGAVFSLKKYSGKKYEGS